MEANDKRQCLIETQATRAWTGLIPGWVMWRGSSPMASLLSTTKPGQLGKLISHQSFCLIAFEIRNFNELTYAPSLPKSKLKCATATRRWQTPALDLKTCVLLFGFGVLVILKQITNNNSYLQHILQIVHFAKYSHFFWTVCFFYNAISLYTILKL